MFSIDVKPSVFVSAVSADLRTVRDAASRVLNTLGCLPVEQSRFPTGQYEAVRQMLRKKIQSCDAVLHVVGLRYGREPDPASLPSGAQRRSYTQLEFDLARELKKPVYVFVCAEDFPYDPPRPGDDPAAEPPELQELQRAHRATLVGGDDTSHFLNSLHDVDDRVRTLDTLLNQMRRRLRQIRALGIAALVLVAIGVVAAVRYVGGTSESLRTNIAEADVKRSGEHQQVRGSLDEMKAEMARLSQAVTEMAQPRAGDDGRDPIADLTDDEYYAELSRRAKLDPGVIHAILAAARMSNDLSVRAEAALVARRYDEAEQLSQRAEQEKLRQLAPAMRSVAEDELRRGKALHYREKYVEALEVLHRSRQRLHDLPPELAADRRPEAEAWFWIARTHDARLAALEGSERQRCLFDAVAGYREALAIYTREATPTDWAKTQNNLAIELRGLAKLTTGKQQTELLAEAVATYRAALEVYTRETAPTAWARTQNNLVIALLDQAQFAGEEQRADFFAEAVGTYRAILDVWTRDGAPTEWAAVQNNLAIALSEQALLAGEDRQTLLLAEAVDAYRAALNVYTRATNPIDWAMTQINLAHTLKAQAKPATKEKRAELLAEVIACFRGALEVRTRKAFPDAWAATQHNLAISLSDQAWAGPEEQQAELQAEAVSAYRAALEVYTREAAPIDWAMTHHGLADVLYDQATFAGGVRRNDLLAEAVASYRAALEIFTRAANPTERAATQRNLYRAVSRQAALASGTEQSAFEREAAQILRELTEQAAP